MNHPQRYFITRKVRQNFARIMGKPFGELADPMTIFPLFRQTIHLSPVATAQLLNDPRRATAEQGSFWLGVDGRLLWVVFAMRIISVIQLTEMQKDRAINEHGIALRARRLSVAGDYDPAPDAPDDRIEARR